MDTGPFSVKVLVACVGFVAIACSGSTTGASVHSPLPTPTVQNCLGLSEVEPTTPSPPAGVTYPQMTVDGKLRDYRLFIPPALKLTAPVPLVIVLHGAPIDAAGFENIIHFDPVAVAGGFIEASPNGCDGMWSYADGGPKTADEDFIEQVVVQLEARYPIDQRRVYAVGASAGSWIAYLLACDFADHLTAIASVAGTMRLTDPCAPARPVSVIEIHGTHDNQHPWEGEGPHHAFPVDAVMQKWVTLDGCAGAAVATHSGITDTSTWKSCHGGAQVVLDKVVNGHHTWFGSDLDPVPGEPDANTLIWRFFTGLHPKT